MKTNYSFWETSAEANVIGVRDGLSQVRLKDDMEKKYPWIDKFMWLEPGEAWPDLNTEHINNYDGHIEFNLRRHAKLTDVLNVAPFMYGVSVVSERLKDILEEFRIGNIQFRKIQINSPEGKPATETYYIMQTPFDPPGNIDWKNTFFYKLVQKHLPDFNENTYYWCNNYEEYKKTFALTSASITFVSDPELDVVKTACGLLISDRLEKVCKGMGISNMEIRNFHKNINVTKHVSEYW